MLTILLTLLSSSGFGSIVGLAGGIVNRLIDIKARNADRAFELQKMDKEREFMKEEYQNRIQVATVEAESRVESAAYEALQESYNYAKTSAEDGFVDKVAKFIRPFLTIAFFVFTIYVFYKVNTIITDLRLTPSADEIFKLWKSIIEWIFFQAGVAIGWWFAMRPGRTPTFKG